tara:strand:+ start:701 stop:1123 length:423 start_codon:yes stop_codon:yes gene_type:complete
MNNNSIFEELLERRLRQGDNGQQRHGAFAVRTDKRQKQIFGYNQIRGNGKTIHAELSALGKCKKGTYDIYVGRLNGRCSCPCQNCMDRMTKLKKRGIYIRNIIYTDGIDEDGSLKLTEWKFKELYLIKDTLQISKAYRRC